MSIPFSVSQTPYIEPHLPWQITIEVKASTFELMKWEVAELAKRVAKAEVPSHVPSSGGGSDGSGSSGTQYTITLSTPLEAQIEEAEKRLADLKRQKGNYHLDITRELSVDRPALGGAHG